MERGSPGITYCFGMVAWKGTSKLERILVPITSARDFDIDLSIMEGAAVLVHGVHSAPQSKNAVCAF